MNYIKTVSFPASESGTGQVERLRIKLPQSSKKDLVSWLKKMSSKEARTNLKFSYVDLKKRASEQNRSLSNMSLLILDQIFSEKETKQFQSGHIQLSLFNDDKAPLGIKGTFYPNHTESVHRWYPYIEGFSADFVSTLLDEFSKPGNRVYDPFAGTGTMVAVASFRGLSSFYSEVNPFMRLVIECKTNLLGMIKKSKINLDKYFEKLHNQCQNNLPSQEDALKCIHQAFGKKEYFVDNRLIEIVALRNAIRNGNTNELTSNFHKLVLGSIGVHCSELKRAADLRYKTKKERLPKDFSVLDSYIEKATQVAKDITKFNGSSTNAHLINNSCLDQPDLQGYIDLVLTSPPYLNGTNYFRNTKLELWLTGFIKSEKELKEFRKQALAAGINNISKDGRNPNKIDCVEEVANKLDKVAYDKRIPELVRRYFSDSKIWISNSYNILNSGGRAIIDIGDSRFAGVHIPTDELLIKVAKGCGFEIDDNRFVRSRRSKDGTQLKQVLLILRKPKKHNFKLTNGRSENEYLSRAIRFSEELPFLNKPYSSRNWGHGLHSLCSYQGKLKPSIAHFLVKLFTSPGDIVLDPMSGCGTIPLEAFLQKRIAYGNDINELAYILTYAKIKNDSNKKVLAVYNNLVEYINHNKNTVDPQKYDSFGFNGKIPEFYHKNTLKEILSARNYIKENPCEAWEQAVVFSCLLHILHGNRPYALSRRSHPVLPLKPAGEFVYKSLSKSLEDKIKRTLNLSIPEEVLQGIPTKVPFHQLPYENEIDSIITSPPFFDSTKFYIANWLRLWFSGWEPEDYNDKQDDFVEVQQKKSLDIYNLFLDDCFRWLVPNGKLIMHVGRSSKCDMALELTKRSLKNFDLIYSFDEDVSKGEKFGIKDQGRTKSHQYLFFKVKK